MRDGSLLRPILILSAFEPELGPLRAMQEGAAIPQSALRCQPAGIGAIDASLGAGRAIATLHPSFVLFIGTAGSYGDAVPVGAVAIARRVFLASSAVARGDGYLPPPMAARANTDATLRRQLLRSGPRATTFVADVAAPLAITKSASLAARLAETTGAAVENLEAFAVARAAALQDIPFCAVLGIANRVGPRAHAEWLLYQASATVAASRVIEAFLGVAFLDSRFSRSGQSLKKFVAREFKAPNRSPSSRAPPSRAPPSRAPRRASLRK